MIVVINLFHQCVLCFLLPWQRGQPHAKSRSVVQLTISDHPGQRGGPSLNRFGSWGPMARDLGTARRLSHDRWLVFNSVCVYRHQLYIFFGGCYFDVDMHMFDGIMVCPCSRWPVAAGFLSSLNTGQPMQLSSLKSKPEPPRSHCHNSILLASGSHHLSLLRLLSEGFLRVSLNEHLFRIFSCYCSCSC